MRLPSTVIVAVSLHPFTSVPVTVYIVVVVGRALVIAQVPQDRAVAGDQLYVSPPVALTVNDPPHDGPPVVALIVGNAFTVTVVVVVHPASVQVITVVPALSPVNTPDVLPIVAITPTAGLLLPHQQLVGPVNNDDDPTHADVVPVTVGDGSTVMVTVSFTIDGDAHGALLVI